MDGTPGLTLDGGAGDGDTLVIRITNPVPYDPIFSAADLPANITNFENVELVYDLEPPPEPDPTPDPTPDPPPLYGYAYAADGGLMYHDGNGGFVIVPA
ncbi:MAG: hypothetical protein HC850_04030 [Rhodomicrobium sp.]|nr:hypothetical protein [Rhodomicrobium sp.]